MRVSHDRGDIIGFIGQQHGSPALKKGSGEPLISTGHADAEVQRVGWAAFFAEVEKRKLDLSFDPATGEHHFVPRGSAVPSGGPTAPHG
jgi:hypothetical protein